MGFADEIKAARHAEPAGTPPADKVTQDAPEGMNTGLPPGSDPLEVQPEQVAPEAQPAPKAEAKIKIGTQEFNSMEDAVEYAKQLDLARAQDQAYIEGMKAAKPQEVAPAQAKQKALEEEVEEMFFEDPKAAIKKLSDGIKKQIFDAYNQSIQETETAKQREAQVKGIWDGFYGANTDLSESKDIVEFLRVKNWDKIKDIPQDKALNFLADEARKQLKISKQATLPRTELPGGPARVAGVSGESTQSSSAPVEAKELDFIQQLNKLRKKSPQV